MSDTLIKCKCCEDPQHSAAMKFDAALQGHVCAECRRFLFIAEHALFDSKIRGVSRGPYCGNSNG